MIEHPDSAHSESEHRAAGKSALERVLMLDGASAVTVQVELLKESYDEILAVAAASGYEHDEAVRIVLLSGLGYETGRLNFDGLNQVANLGTELSAARVDAIVNELAGYHSMYSVLKFKAYKLYKQNQQLEFNNAGLRAQEQMWNEWADRMRREREALSAEVLRLRAMLSEFSLNWEAAGGPQLPQAMLEAARLKEAVAVQAEVEDTPASEEASQIAPEPPPRLLARLKRFLKPD